jgi:type II secretory pathway pseudopilin PulG
MTRRVSSEGGFGLVELLIALTVMALGISAIAAGFTSGIVALNRASRIGTAGTIADRQMEFYRGLPYTSIALGSNGVGTYTTDPAYPGSGNTITACASSCMLGTSSSEYAYCNAHPPATPPAFPEACTPRQTPVTGPDGRSYRVDTFIGWYCGVGTLTTSGTVGGVTYSSSSPGCISAGAVVARPVKQVTVVVGDASTTKTYYRETTTFDQAT